MWFKTSASIKFMVKAAIYLCLIVIVYFYQIVEVINKFNEKLTNIAISDEKMEHGIKPPFMTLCSGPRAKQEVLDKHKMSLNFSRASLRLRIILIIDLIFLYLLFSNV